MHGAACVIVFCACVCACNAGQAPWKQQQRSSAFKWIKTPAQSPGPAGIGQTGCSLDEDLRLIISHAAFVFAATVAYIGNTVLYMDILRERQVLASQSANCLCSFLPSVLNLLPSSSTFEHYQLCRSGKIPPLWMCIPAECLCLVCRHAACLIYAIICELLLWFPLDPVCVTPILLAMCQHQLTRSIFLCSSCCKSDSDTDSTSDFDVSYYKNRINRRTLV